ncbi:hypothetical protein RF11_02139 [Thelohanellus kitauei]|uniref:Uncharacterized protein n=1 Tax=Thelohanellus kitauei TaxID=669202 RepID=A0A0C2I628_THEKT|nr:hypothetical protein RF11_02139 [Thelohanellus kitauei]
MPPPTLATMSYYVNVKRHDSSIVCISAQFKIISPVTKTNRRTTVQFVFFHSIWQQVHEKLIKESCRTSSVTTRRSCHAAGLKPWARERNITIRCFTLYALYGVLGKKIQSEVQDVELIKVWDALSPEKNMQENTQIELSDVLEADERLATVRSF